MIFRQGVYLVRNSSYILILNSMGGELNYVLFNMSSAWRIQRGHVLSPSDPLFLVVHEQSRYSNRAVSNSNKQSQCSLGSVVYL